MRSRAAGSCEDPDLASLYVGDLAHNVNEAMMWQIFGNIGPVASIRLCRDSVTRKYLGYAYVNYFDFADAQRALDTLNYSNINGKCCRIMWSERDSSLRKSGTGNIFVKNLDKKIDNKALFDIFSLFGSIKTCKVSADKLGNSHGYGFVHFETEEAAQLAIDRFNGMVVSGKAVQVSHFLQRGERLAANKWTYTNLYVKSFPQEWDEDDLEELFQEYGKVTSSFIQKDKLGRKFAFVKFENAEDAQAAANALHGKDMCDEAQAQLQGATEEFVQTDDGPERCIPGKLYVGPARSLRERQAELREQFAQRRTQDPETEANLYIKNLDAEIDDAQLHALFEGFGTIRSHAVRTNAAGKCKGFGFVAFTQPEEAREAIRVMHQRVVNGKTLYVAFAERRDVRAQRLREQGRKGGKGGQKPCRQEPKGRQTVPYNVAPPMPMNHPMNQPINHPMHYPMNYPMNHPMNWGL